MATIPNSTHYNYSSFNEHLLNAEPPVLAPTHDLSSIATAAYKLAEGGMGMLIGGYLTAAAARIATGILSVTPLSEDNARKLGKFCGVLFAVNNYEYYISPFIETPALTTSVKIGTVVSSMFMASAEGLHLQNRDAAQSLKAMMKGAAAGCLLTCALQADGFAASVAQGALVAYTVSELASR